MSVRVINSALTTPGFFATGGATIPTTVGSGVGVFVPKQELPYTINWNGAVSHAFWGKLNTEIKYMGHHGVNLPLQDFLADTRVTETTNLPVFFTKPGLATLNSLTTTQAGLVTATNPFILAGFTNPILTTRPDGNSWYNAAAIKLSENLLPEPR
jgi:hypothetical protein